MNRVKYGHRGNDLEVAVFGAPAKQYASKLGATPISAYNAGYSVTIQDWDNERIKTAEKNELNQGLGQEKVKKTAAKLQEWC